jgi:hypothetical protein
MSRPWWWADDAFRSLAGHWGGELVDLCTPVAGRDKVQHLVLGAGAWLVLWALGLPLVPRAAILVGLCVLWELVELARLWRWRRAGAVPPWPFAADAFSWRDVVAGLAGAVLCEGPLVLRGLP